eukprot:12072378-Ditylum_brightwellii.AAC.1
MEYIHIVHKILFLLDIADIYFFAMIVDGVSVKASIRPNTKCDTVAAGNKEAKILAADLHWIVHQGLLGAGACCSVSSHQITQQGLLKVDACHSISSHQITQQGLMGAGACCSASSHQITQQGLLGVVLVDPHPPIRSPNKIFVPMHMSLPMQFYPVQDLKLSNKIF